MKRLTDGFKTLITFSLNGAVKFYEKEVKPAGLDRGGPIDQTTMRNTAFRTAAAKQLTTVSPVTATVNYDPAVKAQIAAMLGQNQQITITYPDTSTDQFWGFIDKFEPAAVKEGEAPTAEVTFQPTNLDNSGNEAAPTWAT